MKNMINFNDCMKWLSSSPFMIDDAADFNDFEFYSYDKNGNQITLLNKKKYWIKQFDQNKRVIAFQNSEGYWSKATFNQQGNQLTFENSKGHWSKAIYDKRGQMMSFEDYSGEKIYRKFPLANK